MCLVDKFRSNISALGDDVSVSISCRSEAKHTRTHQLSKTGLRGNLTVVLFSSQFSVVLIKMLSSGCITVVCDSTAIRRASIFSFPFLESYVP